MLGEPFSTSSYRCIRLPPGKKLSSEIAQRSPIFHVYAGSMGRDVTSGPVTNDLQLPQLSSLPTKVSTSSRSPAPADEAIDTTAPSRMSSYGLVTERPTTPSLYVLRSRSSLSQDGNVKCGIREVSCGLERGPVFTPIQPSAFSTTVRRAAITPAGVHRTPRPERHHSARRTASASLMTPPRSAQLSPPSRAPSRDGLVNEGYSSD
ncbi:uncharacterized protein LOC142768397 [Rhipicephalus microplus]|uniref:uncharacterized protein LOC142768397 n=1 Tax=Rhipicephalus microplus TaxID=6941 RepID=UPI003F6D60D9